MTPTKYSTFVLLLIAAALTVPWIPACQSDCHDGGHDCGAGGHAHGGEDGVGASGGGAMKTLAEQYCDCLLGSCHDAYHSAFGGDEADARESCLAEAEALPVAGEEVTEGNFVECRLHHCELGTSDETACPSALGGEACSDGSGGTGGGTGGAP